MIASTMPWQPVQRQISDDRLTDLPFPQAEVQPRAEALSTRDRLGLAAVAREELDCRVEAGGAVVIERRQLQPIVPISNMALSWNGSTLSPPTSRILSIES
jgi:hypothetical protein